MDRAWLKRIQTMGTVLVMATAVPAVFTSCSGPGKNTSQPKASSYALKADDYVTPRKIYPYDLKSAVKELAGKGVWVRPGSPLAYYRYNSAAHSVDMTHKAGLLPTLSELEVEDVVLERIPVSLAPGQVAIVRRQMMAVFAAPGLPGKYAVAIATEAGDSYNFSVNEEFFFEDPHQLYSHWPADVWSAIDRHEAREGMNELQVSFALGSAVRSKGADYWNRSIEYSSSEKPVTVTFEKDRAVKVVQGALQ